MILRGGVCEASDSVKCTSLRLAADSVKCTSIAHSPVARSVRLCSRPCAAGFEKLWEKMAAAVVRKKRQSSRHPVTQEDDGPILMPCRTMVKGRWRIERQLAKGAFGQISVARDLETNRLVAVKAEAIDAEMTFLRIEVDVLRSLQAKSRQVPRFIACGHTPHVNYLIIQLLGPSVMELKKRLVDDRFSIGTGVRVADQMLCALQCLHEVGYIHRDVKPSNFVIGCGKGESRLIFMLDFGLCRQFIDPVTGKQRPPRMRCGFRGTVRYACIGTLKSLEVGRESDLWSLFYVLIEMLNGQLPWRRIYEKQQVLQWKESMPPAQLLHGLPVELSEFAEHVQSLDYYTRPDYDRIHCVFSAVLARHNILEESPMDWDTMLSEHCDLGDQNAVRKESGKSEAGEGEEATQAAGVKVDDSDAADT